MSNWFTKLITVQTFLIFLSFYEYLISHFSLIKFSHYKSRFCCPWKKMNLFTLLYSIKTRKVERSKNLVENAILQNKIARSEKVYKLSEESFELGIFTFRSKWKTVHTSVLISRFACFLFLAGVNKTTIYCNKMSYFNVLGFNKQKICRSSLNLLNARY